MFLPVKDISYPIRMNLFQADHKGFPIRCLSALETRPLQLRPHSCEAADDSGKERRMAEIKTRPTEMSVDAFLDGVGHPGRRADGKAVRAMMERVTGEPATMWGPSIVGFGRYHYRYASGHEGDMCRLGFSPRSAHLVLYVGGFPEYEALLARLGKHKRSRACLYLNKLADVDPAVLEEIVRRTWATTGDVDHGPVS
jgi:hypothetical protein